jgi:cerevisin
MVSAWLALAGLSAVVSAIPSSTDTVWSTPSKPRPFVLAPLITPNVAQERIIADTYVVLLKNSISGSQVARHINEVASKKFGDPLLVDDGGLRHVYDAPGFKGYAGKFTAATIELLRSQPEIELIEKSQIFRTADTEHDAPWASDYLVALRIIAYYIVIGPRAYLSSQETGP